MNPYVLLGIVGLWIISLTSVGFWQHHEGALAIQVKWDRAIAQQNVEVANKLQQLTRDRQAAEQQGADNVAAVSTKYEQEKSDEHKKTEQRIASIMAGTLQLHDPYSTTTTRTSPAGSVAIPIRGGYAETNRRLSAEASEFLLRLTGEADQIVQQLDACQQMIVIDRQTLQAAYKN